jgi:hypothetical protein
LEILQVSEKRWGITRPKELRKDAQRRRRWNKWKEYRSVRIDGGLLGRRNRARISTDDGVETTGKE